MSGGEVFQNVALLLLQRRYHRHHTLDKARTVFTLRAKAALTPLHTWADRAFGCSVRGLHPCDLHERPQRLAPLENLPAGPFGFHHATLAPRFQQAFYLATKRRHGGAKRGASQGALAHPMPPRKHLVRLRKQGVATRLRGPTSASHRFKVPKHMRPA